jgi:hypothetical protein
MPGVPVEGAFELIDAAEIGEGGARSGVGLVEAGDGLREIAVGIAGVCEVMGCRTPHACDGFPSTAAELLLSGGLRQTRAKDVHCTHNRPHSLLMSGQGGSVTWDELAQPDIATTQRLHGLKAFQKTLPSGHRPEASRATQPVPNGDMTTFDALGGLTPTPMQTSPDVGGAGQDSIDCLHVGLVMIAD